MKALRQVVVLWGGDYAAMLPTTRTELTMPLVEMAHIRCQEHEPSGCSVAQLLIISEALRLFALGCHYHDMALLEIIIQANGDILVEVHSDVRHNNRHYRGSSSSALSKAIQYSISSRWVS